jgi:hypothetical protein
MGSVPNASTDELKVGVIEPPPPPHVKTKVLGMRGTKVPDDLFHEKRGIRPKFSIA